MAVLYCRPGVDFCLTDDCFVGKSVIDWGVIKPGKANLLLFTAHYMLSYTETHYVKPQK